MQLSGENIKHDQLVQLYRFKEKWEDERRI